MGSILKDKDFYLVSDCSTVEANDFVYPGKFEGASPLQKQSFPLSFEGEGEKGGEVDI